MLTRERSRSSVAARRSPTARDRDEEEVRGYRDALAWIHRDTSAIPVNEETVRRLHAMARGELGHEVGRYISLERLSETSNERCYETLEQSS